MLPEISEDLQELNPEQEKTDRISTENFAMEEFSSSIGHSGIMGVPITFFLKYCPEQFEIIGCTESEGKGFSNGIWDEDSGVAQPMVDGSRVYKRIFIRNIKRDNQ